ncbi:MAG: DUF692 family protein [Chloroflexi bacterium]|nr:DUF692 family protein [Chloroflexota bacterium]
MQYALNYSPQAVQALNNGAITIDLFKCPPWKDLTRDARALKPIYIHFPLRAGSLHKTNWSEIERWMRQSDTPKVNLHLYVRSEDLPGIEDQSEASARDRVKARFISDLQLMVKRFGAENVIAENVPFGRRSNDKHALSYCVEPDLIREVLETTGCGLLLDTAHATITAQSLGIDPVEYVLSLPIERTGEVHVTGVRDTNDGLMDHLAFTEEDFQTNEIVLEALKTRGARPWVMTCEYGGVTPQFDWRSNYDVIVHDTTRLVAMLQKFNAAPVNTEQDSAS